MIFNTYYWKRELERRALVLRGHMAQRRWVAASDASVEKAVMLGFYAVRKIAESFGPPLRDPSHLRVTTFRRGTGKPSPIVFPDVLKAFDLTAPKMVSMPLRDVCNEIIHSHFFSLWLDRSRTLRGVFVASDWNKNKRICRLDIERIAILFEGIARARGPVSLTHFVPDNNRVVM
jgi:hypothetical protein